MTAHPLAGSFSVEVSARLIRHYRYVEERMMRLLGGWIALTPEVPVKLLFGRHVWDCAQHADAWGKRLPELRSPAQQSEPANDQVVAFMDLLQSCQTPETTPERVTGLYRVLKPHLAAVYARHLADANGIYEPPTRRILQRCLDEERRHIAAGALIVDRLGGGAEWRRRAEAWERRLLEALGAAGGVTGAATPVERDFAAPSADTAAEASPWHPARDVVAVGSAFDSAVVPEDLADRVNAHGRALRAGDLEAALGDVLPEARGPVEALYGMFRGPVEQWRIVACAKIGAFRVVKVAVEGPAVRATVQMQWRPEDGTWRIAAADVVAFAER
jgi:hypothetical protein